MNATYLTELVRTEREPMKTISELITRLAGLREHLALGEKRLRRLAKSKSEIVATATTEADRMDLVGKAIAEIEFDLADQLGPVSLTD